VMPSVNVITFSEREEESADFNNIYSPTSSPPLIDTDKCSLTLPPVSPESVLSVFHVFEVRACSAPSISTALEVETR